MSRTPHSARDSATDRTKQQSSSPSADPANVRAQRSATEVDLRQALATSLPDNFGLTLKQTAEALGRSISWVAKVRAQARSNSKRPPATHSHGGRRNQILQADEEAIFMEDVCKVYIKIHSDWRMSRVRGPAARAATMIRFEEHVRSLLEARSGRSVSRATAYNLMARVGKAKFANYKPWRWHQYCEPKFYL